MLYKYYRVSDRSLSGIRNHELYCNHYERFNDPFECWGIVRSDFPNRETDYERFLAAIRAWGFTEDRLAEALVNYEDYFFSLEGTQPSVQATLDHARISCFCAEPDNLLMWAHYADGLRGFCLEFDEALLCPPDQEQAHILDVIYSSRPPVIDTAVYAIALDQYDWNTFEEDHPEDAAMATALMAEIHQKLLASKPIQWEYEKERRLIVDAAESATRAGVSYSYASTALKAVIVGERMESADRRQLQDSMRQLGVSVPVRTARRSRTTYSVRLD